MNLSSQFISTQLATHHPVNNIIIGYSGGLDSHVLLHLLANIPEFKHKILAVYVHHGLQAQADGWAIHCVQVAKALGVNFKVLHVNARSARKQSPEEAARNARYQAFKQLLKENDLLLFAQHRDDQLETVLLQLFRGAGLKGLSGMPAIAPLGAGKLLRPLLDTNQQAIKHYAQAHGLQWIEDPSNQDTQIDRNYLRHNIIPLLAQRWPSLDKTVARVAGHCADAQSLLSNSAKQKMHLILDINKQCLSIAGLLKHDELTQQWIIREWINHLGARMPTQKVLTAIVREVLHARPEATPVVQHDGYNIQRYRDDLYLNVRQKKPDLKQIFNWGKGDSTLSLGDNGVLSLEEADQGIAKDVWQQGSIQVKYRQGGEKISLPHRAGRHSLKKLYQEAGIAPWQRGLIPLIYINNELAAVADYWISANFYAQDTPCISLHWGKQRIQ